MTTTKDKPLHGRNSPNQNRLSKDDMEIYTPRGSSYRVARVKDPLRIDKLLARGTINHEQHLYGMQIITLHEIIHYTKGSHLDDMPRIQGNADNAQVNKLQAVDQYNMVMRLMCGQLPQYWSLVAYVCFDDLPLRKACHKSGITQHDLEIQSVRDAFDLLGDCLQEMRTRKEYLEKTFCS